VTLRPDEDYADTFERGWALAMGVVAFVTPWLMFATTDWATNESRVVWAERVDLLVWILGATLGVAGLVAGRRVRRIGRIGTAIIVGDALGFLLFWVSVVALLFA